MYKTCLREFAFIVSIVYFSTCTTRQKETFQLRLINEDSAVCCAAFVFCVLRIIAYCSIADRVLYHAAWFGLHQVCDCAIIPAWACASRTCCTQNCDGVSSVKKATNQCVLLAHCECCAVCKRNMTVCSALYASPYIVHIGNVRGQSGLALDCRVSFFYFCTVHARTSRSTTGEAFARVPFRIAAFSFRLRVHQSAISTHSRF